MGELQGEAVRMQVLVVDDEPTAREVLRLALERQGCETAVAGDAAGAIALLDRQCFHAVITDKNMPGTDHPTEGGLDVVRFAKTVNPSCAVLMMTAYASMDSAIEAMQLGAFDYVTKPVRPEDLKIKLDRVLEYQQTIDPAGAFAAYGTFRDQFLASLDQGQVGQRLSEEVKASLFEAMQRVIDGFFHERRAWENIIFEQREALTRIAAWAEELRDVEAPAGRAGDLLEKIVGAASQRV